MDDHVTIFFWIDKALTDEDVHHSGTVSASALHEILNQHAFRMTSDQFNHIWMKLPKNSDGAVDYREFLKIFSTRPEITRAASATPPHSRDRRVGKYTFSESKKFLFPTGSHCFCCVANFRVVRINPSSSKLSFCRCRLQLYLRPWKAEKELKLIHDLRTMKLCPFQASYEPAMSPVHTPVRIPLPESLTPPLSASDVERNIKDAVSIIVRLRKYVKELFPNLDVLPKVQYWECFFLIRSVVGGSRFRNPSGTSTVATRERWILNNLKVGATPVDRAARRTHLFLCHHNLFCKIEQSPSGNDSYLTL